MSRRVAAETSQIGLPRRRDADEEDVDQFVAACIWPAVSNSCGSPSRGPERRAAQLLEITREELIKDSRELPLPASPALPSEDSP